MSRDAPVLALAFSAKKARTFGWFAEAAARRATVLFIDADGGVTGGPPALLSEARAVLHKASLSPEQWARLRAAAPRAALFDDPSA
jgi:hypothetical protein